MTNETKIAGLSEFEANEKLCEWLNKRTGKNWGIGFQTQKGEKRPMICSTSLAAASKENPFFTLEAFTDSDDSMRRVLNAMREAERTDYGVELARICAWQDSWGFLFATPAQKCEAALRALGLAKEEG